MQNKYVFFRAVVWLVCLYHVTFGVLLNCPSELIDSTAKSLMGATKLPDASALFLARMVGTYMLVFGIGMGVAAWNPVKNRALLTIGVILVVLRALQRVVQANDLTHALGVSSSGNWATIIILLVFAAILGLFRLRILQDQKKDSPL